jgi:carbon storage regulator
MTIADKAQGVGNLVVSRYVGERIMIGDDIEIVVSEVGRGAKGMQVRLRVVAPRNIPVLREELFREIHHSGTAH